MITSGEEPSIADLYKICLFDAARHRTRHAVNVGIASVEDAICSAPTGRVRADYAFLTMSGLRGADFEKLHLVEAPQIRVTPTSLEVDVDVAKNRRDPESKTNLRITDKMTPHLWRPRLVEVLRADRQSLEFRASDLRGVGSFFELQDLRIEGGRQATSYTLRRSFCHRAIAYCTRPDDTVDWEKAITFTLHKNVNSLKAAYAEKVADAHPAQDGSEIKDHVDSE